MDKKVKIRSLLTGKVYDAEFRIDHPASSYGQPVLVLKQTGEAVDQVFFEILKENEEVK